MPLTPADVHNVAFKKPPIGKRGYDEEEVDAFLDEAEQELARLMEENRALREQMDHAVPGQGAPSALGAELAEVHAQLALLLAAKAEAEANTRNLRAQLDRTRDDVAADSLLADGDRNHVRVLTMAQRTAEDHLEEARRESDTLIREAQRKAEEIEADARSKADAGERDAERRHAEAMSGLEKRRSMLVEELRRLGQMEQDYRRALHSHLAQQLESLNSVSAINVNAQSQR